MLCCTAITIMVYQIGHGMKSSKIWSDGYGMILHYKGRVWYKQTLNLAQGTCIANLSIKYLNQFAQFKIV